MLCLVLEEIVLPSSLLLPLQRIILLWLCARKTHSLKVVRPVCIAELTHLRRHRTCMLGRLQAMDFRGYEGKLACLKGLKLCI